MKALNTVPDLKARLDRISGSALSDVQSLEQRSGVLQNLIRTYRQVEGEIHPTLIKEGFVLVDQLREEQEKKSPGSLSQKGRGVTSADHLEAMLVGEYSRDNFSMAMQYARSIPDQNLKLAALIAIVQSQGQNY